MVFERASRILSFFGVQDRESDLNRVAFFSIDLRSLRLYSSKTCFLFAMVLCSSAIREVFLGGVIGEVGIITHSFVVLKFFGCLRYCE